MVMNDNEFGTKENKIQTKDKTEPQHIHVEDKIFRSGILHRSISLYQLLTLFFPILFFSGHFLGFIFRNKMFPK